MSIRKPRDSPPPLTGEGEGGGDNDGDIKAFHFYSPSPRPSYCQNYSPLPLGERVRVRGEKSTRIVSKTPSMLMNTPVSVEPFLNALATSLSSFTPTLFHPPSRGRDALVFL